MNGGVDQLAIVTADDVDLVVAARHRLNREVVRRGGRRQTSCAKAARRVADDAATMPGPVRPQA
jgi:hypothetical protein